MDSNKYGVNAIGQARQGFFLGPGLGQLSVSQLSKARVGNTKQLLRRSFGAWQVVKDSLPTWSRGVRCCFVSDSAATPLEGAGLVSSGPLGPEMASLVGLLFRPGLVVFRRGLVKATAAAQTRTTA